MNLPPELEFEVSQELVEAVESFPTSREIQHCGQTFSVSPFEIYTKCPACDSRIKVRAFSGNLELEDLFDAFFTWLAQPGAAKLAVDRQKQLESE